jgi:hypothetical protein
LPPTHALDIGGDYFHFLDGHSPHCVVKYDPIHLDLLSRYGKYQILENDRKGHIVFYNKVSHKKLSLNAKDALENLKVINELDPAQAFYLGFFASQKIARSLRRNSSTNQTTQSNIIYFKKK